MRFTMRFRAPLVLALSIGLTLSSIPMLPQSVTAADGLRPAEIRDVELAPGGLLRGYLLDAQGRPRAGQSLQLRGPSRPMMQVVSDAQGGFAVPDLAGGVIEFVDGTRSWHVRCWAHGTAPPSSVAVLCLAGEQDVVRGQVAPGCWGLNNPWVIAGLVAAAIAIPIALSNNRDDRDDASE